MIKTTRSGISLVLLALLLAGCGTTEPESAGKMSVTVEQLNSENGITVVGKLGVPLGTFVCIEGTVVAGHTLGNKLDQSRYLLRVNKVNGRQLNPEPLMHFESGDDDLPDDHDGLHRWKSGKDAPGSYDDTVITEMEKGYVGSRVRLIAYEEGGFDGAPQIPEDLSDMITPPAMPGFAFYTKLAIEMRLSAAEECSVVPPSKDAWEKLEEYFRPEDEMKRIGVPRIGTRTNMRLGPRNLLRQAISGKTVSIIEVTIKETGENPFGYNRFLLVFDEKEKRDLLEQPFVSE